MANFGFERLTVVAPYAPHWREAKSAVGAPGLLKNAREVATLAEAVAACTLVAGTGTLTHRKPEQRVIQLPELALPVSAEIAAAGRVALVFGPEKHGLTREDLSFCHLLVEIPTDARQPSMNLGQAAAVCLYELAAHTSRSLPDKIGQAPPTPHLTPKSAFGTQAASGILDRIATLIEETSVAAGYSPRSMQDANRHDLRLLLRRLGPSERDSRRILGFFRRVLRRLSHPPNR